MYNLLSLALGFAAWGMGVAAICKKGCPRWVFGSFTACGASLLVQFLEIRRLVELSDWSALLDTMDAEVLAAAVLLSVTAALNFTALVRRKRKCL